MNHGFAIDTRSCIGCHACSTACKSENQVPIGVSRTWVKYTEVGTYPDVKRNFQVTRCNHCSNPPCVRICPVTAMYQRTDGIVEFDSDVCIGCKGCMQACPYDAVYIDPSTGTAAKCHFCAHRVETGLEPACVVVCPTHSIIAGDLDDPNSEISRAIAKNNVTVRKPEQGTAPKLFYVDGHDVAMHPTATEAPKQMIWADTLDRHGAEAENPYLQTNGGAVTLRFDEPEPAAGGCGGGGGGGCASSGTEIRTPGLQGLPSAGPIAVAPGTQAEHMVQTVYNAQHKVPWHWQVPAYLVTKALGAGIFLWLSLAVLAGWPMDATGALVKAGGLGILGLLATTALLVADLERPERFLRILLRPQWKSWLTRGAFILVIFTHLVMGWWGLELAADVGWVGVDTAAAWRPMLAGLTLPLAVGAAVYTAFLFAQCEGRDLWQTPVAPVHMLLQSAMAGAAGLVLLGIGGATVASLLLGLIIADAALISAEEFGSTHQSEQAAQAAHMITHGAYKNWFWWGTVATGHLLPIALLLTAGPALGIPAALATLVGLYAYEHAFVMAPQDIPNS